MDMYKLFEVVQNLNNSMKNLSKDIDENNPREKTKEDLTQVNMSFQELREILSSLKTEDHEELQREFYELMNGEESFQEYINDVNKIINNVRARTKQSPEIQKKIENNMPTDAKAKDAPSLFSNYQQLFSQIGNFIESMQNVKR